jgi:2-keto-4-pentenoate hydratase
VDGTVALGELLHPKVEPELVYRCGVDLPPQLTPAEVAAGGEWAVGLEVVDPRFPSFDFDWLDNTADNSSAARVVVGEFGRPETAAAELEVELVVGDERRTGSGSAAMGDPCAAVAWLARSLAEVPAKLRRGDIVFTGGLTAPFDVRAGVLYQVRCDELGAAAFAAAGH